MPKLYKVSEGPRLIADKRVVHGLGGGQVAVGAVHAGSRRSRGALSAVDLKNNKTN